MITGKCQNTRSRISHRLCIIHNQNSLSSPFHILPSDDCFGHGIVVNARKINPKRASFTRFAVNPDLSSALLYDAEASGKPQTGPGRFGREKWLKNPASCRFVHSNSGVAEHKHHVSSGKNI